MTSFRRLILLRRRSCLSFCFLFPSVSWAYGRVLFGFLNHLLLLVKVGCIYSSCDVTYGLKLLVLDIAPVPNASYGMPAPCLHLSKQSLLNCLARTPARVTGIEQQHVPRCNVLSALREADADALAELWHQIAGGEHGILWLDQCW